MPTRWERAHIPGLHHNRGCVGRQATCAAVAVKLWSTSVPHCSCWVAARLDVSIGQPFPWPPPQPGLCGVPGSLRSRGCQAYAFYEAGDGQPPRGGLGNMSQQLLLMANLSPSLRYVVPAVSCENQFSGHSCSMCWHLLLCPSCSCPPACRTGSCHKFATLQQLLAGGASWSQQ
jgi:hypothetical protein